MYKRQGLSESEEPDPQTVSEFEERYKTILSIAGDEYPINFFRMANIVCRYVRGDWTLSTDAVLAATLKDLIADGIVDRKSYDEIPPVAYTHLEIRLGAV